MKRSIGTVTAHEVAPLKLFGVMAVVSGLTFATLVAIHQLFFSHSLYA
jgi:hypothetical protein